MSFGDSSPHHGRSRRSFGAVLVTLTAVAMLMLGASGHGQGTPAEATRPDPPPLPFDDNPDPDQCGIPAPLGDGVFGTVHGSYEGELVFEEVHLYSSHLRSSVTGLVPDGTRVQAILFQQNPTLNYYMVRWDGPDGTVEGWLPAPFFELER